MSEALRITTIEGTGIPLRGDDIDTDRIIPARYLRTVSFEGLEQHVFEDDRTITGHPFNDSRYSGARVLFVDRNFGCGSSREHAPQALYRWGIRAIVGVSFSDIFFGNAALVGLPCVSAAPDDVNALMSFVEQHPRGTIRVDLHELTCRSTAVVCAVDMPAAARHAFVSGTWDPTSMLLERFGEVRAVASKLPYLSGFSGLPPA